MIRNPLLSGNVQKEAVSHPHAVGEVIDEVKNFPFTPDIDEVMITITLTPALMELPFKSQLNKSYAFVKNYFDSGMGCFEFTKKGNIHYHIKTTDDSFKVLCFIDDLKTIFFTHNGKKTRVFGFNQVDKTFSIEKIGNYDYLYKDDDNTRAMLKRKKLDLVNIWENKPYVPNKVNIKLKDMFIKSNGKDNLDNNLFDS
ncbi:MAG: hypothetical protein H7836_17375 [Magnetococcus sp. YQC-3]